MNRAVCGKTQTARFCMGMDRGKSEQHAEEVRKSDQLNRAEGSRGDSPLQGQGAAPLVGFGATPQPFRGRPVCKTRPTKVQAAKRPCQSLCAPAGAPSSCTFDHSHIVAPDGRDQTVSPQSPKLIKILIEGLTKQAIGYIIILSEPTTHKASKDALRTKVGLFLL